MFSDLRGLHFKLPAYLLLLACHLEAEGIFELEVRRLLFAGRFCDRLFSFPPFLLERKGGAKSSKQIQTLRWICLSLRTTALLYGLFVSLRMQSFFSFPSSQQVAPFSILLSAYKARFCRRCIALFFLYSKKKR